MEAPSVLLALRTVLQAVQHAGDLLCTCAEAADALLEVEQIAFSVRSGASGSRPGKSPAVFVQTIDMRLQRRQAMKRCTQAGPVRVSERRTVWQRPVGIAHHPVDGSRMPGAARGVGQQLGHEVRLVENERGANGRRRRKRFRAAYNASSVHVQRTPSRPASLSVLHGLGCGDGQESVVGEILARPSDSGAREGQTGLGAAPAIGADRPRPGRPSLAGLVSPRCSVHPAGEAGERNVQGMARRAGDPARHGSSNPFSGDGRRETDDDRRSYAPGNGDGDASAGRRCLPAPCIFHPGHLPPIVWVPQRDDEAGSGRRSCCVRSVRFVSIMRASVSPM